MSSCSCHPRLAAPALQDQENFCNHLRNCRRYALRWLQTKGDRLGLDRYQRALRRARVEHDATLEVPGDFTESGGYRAATQLLARSPRPTAIFAANDSMAIGALSALREAGVAVPAEMVVVGFDDIPIARYTSPPLTSVRVPIIELGERATERLVQALASDRRRKRSCETLETALVVRQSCGGSAAAGTH